MVLRQNDVNFRKTFFIWSRGRDAQILHFGQTLLDKFFQIEDNIRKNVRTTALFEQNPYWLCLSNGQTYFPNALPLGSCTFLDNRLYDEIDRRPGK